MLIILKILYNITDDYILGVGIVFGILALVVIVQCGVIMAQYCRIKSLNFKLNGTQR